MVDSKLRPTSNMRPCPSCGAGESFFQREMAGENILECPECGAAFAACLPDEALLRQTYDRLYSEGGVYQHHRYEIASIQGAINGGNQLRVGWERKLFFSALSPRSGDTLLDIGCGTGFFLTAASQRGWGVSGVELSRQAAELGMAAHKFPVHIGRVETAPLQRNHFNAVTAWEVMEHLPLPFDFLKQAHALLRSGGVFAGSVPNYARRRYRYGENLGIASVPPVHLNFWTPESLAHLLARGGFEDVQWVAPRICFDLLRPARSLSISKVLRFFKVLCGLDCPTTVFFMARKP